MKIKIILLSVLLTFCLSLVALNSFAQYTDLHDFDSTLRISPFGTLTQVGAFFYGVSNRGGVNHDGAIFKIKPDGTGYADMFDFNTAVPSGSLYSDGTYLYGMTSSGGLNYSGCIYKIKLDGMVYTDIHDFNDTAGSPWGSLISDGTYLYGMASLGGTNAKGVIFKIKPDGTSYTDLHDFNGTDGEQPSGALVSDGSFMYGTTRIGGTSNFGTIFKIKPDGTGFTVLHNFDREKGAYPRSTLTLNGSNIYGTTYSGGIYEDGIIFSLKTDGTGYLVIHYFDSIDGASPYLNKLYFDGTFLYGMTFYGGSYNAGVIFKTKTDGSGYIKMLDFDNSNGSAPVGSFIADNTFLYGTTSYGGAYNDGVLFKLDITTGVKEQILNKSIDLYPNPSTGIFTISTNERNAELKVMNVLGQEVFSEKIQQNSTTINLSSQPAGVYFVQISTKQGMITKKLIIQR